MKKILSFLASESGIIHTLPLLVIVAAVGIISYLLISSTAPFKGGLFGILNTRPASQAATTVGVWTNVTPPGIILNTELPCGNFGVTGMAHDPLRQSDVYASINCQGVYKSTNYGQTWSGPINTGVGGSGATVAGGISIAPGTPGVPIIYSWNVRGGSTGTWKSTDGGVNWTKLNITPAADQDMVQIVIDPYDSNHLIAVAHERTELSQSIDAGATWTSVPMNSAPGCTACMSSGGGSAGFTFVNTGVAGTTRNTWLWSSQAMDLCGNGGNGGTWRTTNSGVSWTRVDCQEHVHGPMVSWQPGTNGVIYLPGVYSSLGWGTIRSSDYGVTWTHVGSWGQEAVNFGSPNNVYAMYACACQFATGGQTNYQIAPQPGITGWTLQPDPPGMPQGPAIETTVFDGTNYIFVTGNFNGGIWRYVEPASGQTPAPTSIPTASPVPTPVPTPTPVLTPTPTPCSSCAAVFLNQDTTTQGNWKGKYGSNGYSLEADAQNIPSFASINISNALTYTWAVSTTDIRALQKSASTTDRLAATWYNDNQFIIDVNLTDGQKHKVSLYSVDWDNGGRTQKIDVLDANTGTILDSRTLSNFTGGSYLSWNLSGHVQFRTSKTTGNNGVVSGIFFDPSSTPTGTPVPTIVPTPIPTLPAQTSVITITAGGQAGIFNGTTVRPNMILQVNGVNKQSWNGVGGNGQSGQFLTFTYNSPNKATHDQVRVRFTNDQYNASTGQDVNLWIQKINIDGVNFPSNAPSVFSNGVWTPQNGCSGGNKQSIKLSCNGFFQY